MSIYRPPSVDEQPVVEIEQWSIRRIVAENTDHVVGHIPLYHRDGRVTSAIQKYESDTRTVTTKSGRVYKLTGTPGVSSNGEYVWGIWLHHNNLKVEDTCDVTKEYL